LISFQNNLDSAKQNELTALITYLNTLTTLDQKLGTTLQTWGINITKDDNEVRFEGKDVKAKTLLSPVSVK